MYSYALKADRLKRQFETAELGAQRDAETMAHVDAALKEGIAGGLGVQEIEALYIVTHCSTTNCNAAVPINSVLEALRARPRRKEPKCDPCRERRDRQNSNSVMTRSLL